jgi:hypothetical protein
MSGARQEFFRKAVGFRSGLICGIGAVVATLIFLTCAAFINQEPVDTSAAATVDASGPRMSALGGKALRLRNGYEQIDLSCRGECDDLRVEDTETQYGTYEAQVLDAASGCRSCGSAQDTRSNGRFTTLLLDGAVVMTARDFSD